MSQANFLVACSVFQNDKGKINYLLLETKLNMNASKIRTYIKLALSDKLAFAHL